MRYKDIEKFQFMTFRDHKKCIRLGAMPTTKLFLCALSIIYVKHASVELNKKGDKGSPWRTHFAL
jgi:hypothetical protein